MTTRPRHSQATKDSARELRAAGRTYPEIAEELGVSQSSVVYWCRPEYAQAVRESVKRRKDQNRPAVREQSRQYGRANRKRLTKNDIARRRRARAALAREERDRLARSRPKGGTREAYSLVRRALAVLDTLPPTRGANLPVREAQTALHEAEDKIVAAMQAGAQ